MSKLLKIIVIFTISSLLISCTQPTKYIKITQPIKDCPAMAEFEYQSIPDELNLETMDGVSQAMDIMLDTMFKQQLVIEDWNKSLECFRSQVSR